MDLTTAIQTRASVGALTEPAPEGAALMRLLEAGAAAPDHGRLRPWRFFLVRGAARERLGAVFADALARSVPEATAPMLERERAKPMRAPLILVVAAHVVAHPKVPAIEQILAAGAAAQNILLAAHAAGFGAMWRTGEPAYDAGVKAAFGLRAEDAIVGFLYLGTRRDAAAERPRAAPEAREWSGPGDLTPI